MRRISLVIILLAVAATNNVSAQGAPPSAPYGLTISSITPPSSYSSYGQVNLTWTAPTPTVAVNGYKIYRNSVFITSTNALTYTDPALPGGYTYTVSAYNSGGESAQSNSVLAVITQPDGYAPSAPTNVSATTIPTQAPPIQVVISWTASTDNVGVAGYKVYRGGLLLTTSTKLTATTYTDYAPLGTYTYTVTAYDAAGNISNPSYPITVTANLDTTAPSRPINLLATPASSQVNLSWSASYDDVGVKGYRVYRDNAKIADITSTSYTDSGLTTGTYTYSVEAYDAAGNVSSRSLSISANIFIDNIPPSIPVNLSATVTPYSVNLSWGNSIDNIGVAGYYVYRDNTRIGNTSSTFYQNSGLASGTYQFSVAAYDAAANVSGQSLPAVVTLAFPLSTSTPPATTPTPAPTPIQTTFVPPTTAGQTFTISLYYASRNAQVKTLQLFLVQLGYLDSTSATGFFGNLTQRAVKKFQCDHGVVCSGDPANTGWGLVGGKTRAALNALYGNPGSSSAAPANNASLSSADLNAQIQALQQMLLNLQLQLQQKK